MILVDVYFEVSTLQIDRPFLYAYDGEKEIKKGVRVLIDFAHHKNKVGYVTNVREEEGTLEELSSKYGYKISFINDVIDETPILNDELYEIANFISYRYCCPLIGAIQTILPPSLKPKHSFINAPKIKYIKKIRYLKTVEKLTNKQAEILKIIKNRRVIDKNELKNCDYVLNKLKLLGCIEFFFDESKNTNCTNIELNAKKLNNEQERAFSEIKNSTDGVFLLKGITGSGKTEVYFKLIEDVINQGKNAIILVPEINLTPQLKDRVLKNFNCEIAILNSGLTQSQRYEQYRKIVNGEARIVLGTRSAIFAPINNVGIIVIDEEFSSFYKNGNNPYYDTTEIAKFRRKYHNAKLILTSATPSIESMARAQKNIYHLVELKHRFNNQNLPNVSIVDMTNRDNIIPGHSLISKPLYNSLKMVLSDDKQAIILTNKRGYSQRICCSNCEKYVNCPECGFPMFYHKSMNSAFCHHCLKKINIEKLKCDFCEENEFYFIGFGTEKIVEELSTLFPSAKIKQFDSDKAGNEAKISAVLEDFCSNKIDILVGTEMIAKGHNFPNVSLVGILSCEEIMDGYSYNVAEKAFQLITQCVGRTGRDEIEGFAIVQTTNPSNNFIKLACAQDYDLFYKTELLNRKKTANPPYFYLDYLNITTSVVNKNVHEDHAQKLFNLLKSFKECELNLYAKKTISTKKNSFQTTLVVKSKDREKTLKMYNNLLKNEPITSTVKIEVIIDAKE